MIWFTADNHFWHKNVIDYCNRPFQSVEEMNAEMIRRWNFLVDAKDTVFILGDFALAGVKKTTAIIEQLNGSKTLVMGNHDQQNHKASKWIKMGMDHTHYIYGGWFEGKYFNYNHFPYRGHEVDARTYDWQVHDIGNWLLHGHVHNEWKVKNKMINVGVDQWAYTPVSLPEIMREVEKAELTQ